MFEPSLRALGYRPSVEASFRLLSDSTLVPARVVTEHRKGYDVAFAEGVVPAELTGKLRHASTARDELPAVGDWVACRVGDRRAHIHAILPRSSVLRRGLAGGTTEAQLVAANVDVVFLVTALDRDLNPRRIERYLTALHASGAEVKVVLTKADLYEAPSPLVDLALAAARGAELVVTSSATGQGIDALRAALAGDRTGAFVGSSGVGKSSLVNAILGEPALAVGAVAEDGRGRHTTTARELVVVPSGGVLIDTPGMRELRLIGDASDLGGSFDDVEALASKCRFRDCAHEDEPDCAVREGLDEPRYRSYHKLRRELLAVALKKDARAMAEKRKQWKVLARACRARDRE